MPSREDVQKIRGVLKTNAEYVFFFERLNSASWIKPLAEEGFFKAPPEGMEFDGGTRYPPWPDSQYLARVAADAPELAIEVASRIHHTDNPSVQRDLIAVALKTSPKLARRLLSNVLKWIESPHSGWMHHICFGQFAVYLAKGGELDAAFAITEKLLEFLPDPEQEKKRSSPDPDPTNVATWVRLEPRPRSPEHAYSDILEQCIPALTEAAPVRTVALLAKVLNDAITFENRDPASASGQDWSRIWLPGLESDHHTLDAKAALGMALVGCVDKILIRDNSCYEALKIVLNSYTWRIFKRILVHFAGKYRVLSQKDFSGFLLEIARSEALEIDDEYFDFLREHFGFVDNSDQRGYVRMILGSPPVRAYIKNRKSWGKEPPLTEVDDFIRRWQIARLFPIKEFLDGGDLEAYKALLADTPEPVGRVYSRDSSAFVTGWGPYSPKTVEELKTMEPLSVLAFVKSWEWAKGFNRPSPEGLARALQTVVASRALEYSTRANEMIGAERVYIRAFISGLSNTVKEGQRIEWDLVLDLCAWAVTQLVELEPIAEKEWDWEAGDPDWRGVRKAVAGLIQNGANKGQGTTPQHLREKIWGLLEVLTQDSEPTPEYEEKSGWKNQPVTLAINTVRGEAMHALVAHAVWVRRSLPKDFELGFSAMPEVQTILMQKLDSAIEPTGAIRSVFGQFLPCLWYLDRKWVHSNITSIFPHDPGLKKLHESAWNSYVTFNQPQRDIFLALRNEYRWAIETLTDHGSTEHDMRDPREALAEHLVVLYWHGVLDLNAEDGLLKKFYSVTAAGLRAHVIEFVGKALENATEAIPNEVLQRLKNFWGYRFESAQRSTKREDHEDELLGFGWWLHSQKFDSLWLIEQMERVLRFCKTADHELFITKPLAAFCEEFPLQTARCLQVLVEKLPPEKSYNLDEGDVRSILLSALKEKQPEAQTIVEETRNLLLARGCFSYRDIGQESP